MNDGTHPHRHPRPGPAARSGACATRITQGTYWKNSPSLQAMAAGWGLPPMEWLPEKLEKNGMHAHVSQKERIEIYSTFYELC